MNLKLTPADMSAIEQREKDKRVRMYDELTGFGTSIADPKSVDFMNLIHDWRVLSARVAELEKVLEWYAGPAFSQTHNAAGLRQPYPILEDEGHKAREVLNKK